MPRNQFSTQYKFCESTGSSKTETLPTTKRITFVNIPMYCRPSIIMSPLNRETIDVVVHGPYKLFTSITNCRYISDVPTTRDEITFFIPVYFPIKVSGRWYVITGRLTRILHCLGCFHRLMVFLEISSNIH